MACFYYLGICRNVFILFLLSFKENSPVIPVLFFLFPHDPVNQSEQPPKTIRQTVCTRIKQLSYFNLLLEYDSIKLATLQFFFYLLFTYLHIFSWFIIPTHTQFIQKLMNLVFFFFLKLHEYIFNHSSLTICVRKSHLSVSVTLMLMNKYLHS